MAGLVNKLFSDTILLSAAIVSWLAYLGHLDRYINPLNFCGDQTHVIIHRILVLAPAIILLTRTLNIFFMLLILVVVFPVSSGIHILFTLALLLTSDHKLVPILLLVYLLNGISYDPALITCNRGNTSAVTSTSVPVTISHTAHTYNPTTPVTTIIPVTTSNPTTPVTITCAPIVCDKDTTLPRDFIASILCVTKCRTPSGPVVSVDGWLSQECNSIKCDQIPPFGKFKQPLYGVDNYQCAAWLLPTQNTYIRCTNVTSTATTSSILPTLPTVVTAD